MGLYMLILVFAPSGMVVAFYRGRHAEREAQGRTLADQTETYLRMRHRG